MKHLLLIGFAFTSIGGSAWESQWKAGQYIVPVPEHLSPYATFPVMYQANKNTEGKIRLAYKLPEDLVTRETPEIVLEQVQMEGGLIRFEGELGEASCRKSTGTITCFVIYPGLSIDKAAVNSFLDAKYWNLADLALRKNVAQLFSTDPKGIVSYVIE